MQAIVRARDLHLIASGNDSEAAVDTAVSVSLPEPENPYKGLRAFQAADYQDFFGREKLTEKLIQAFGRSRRIRALSCRGWAEREW